MAAPNHAKLRQHILDLLQGGQAHVSFDKALAGMPVALRGKKPRSAPHSAWELLEHIRIALHDMLEFTRDSKWISPPWPGGYWPSTAAPPNAKAWNTSCAAVKKNLDSLMAMVADPEMDLLAPLPHAPDKTLLRSALIAADHNAYHLGQLVELRKMLGAWKG